MGFFTILRVCIIADRGASWYVAAGRRPGAGPEWGPAPHLLHVVHGFDQTSKYSDRYPNAIYFHRPTARGAPKEEDI